MTDIILYIILILVLLLALFIDNFLIDEEENKK